MFRCYRCLLGCALVTLFLSLASGAVGGGRRFVATQFELTSTASLAVEEKGEKKIMDVTTRMAYTLNRRGLETELSLDHLFISVASDGKEQMNAEMSRTKFVEKK